ncbi:hypothetical protein ACHAW5_005304, partial [Stephanodiscus triporus]
KNDGDYWINLPRCKDHWKNSFGWGSGRVYDKEILKVCDLYITCEPCIMRLSMMGIKRVFFGCKNDRFGCPSPSKHHGFEIIEGFSKTRPLDCFVLFTTERISMRLIRFDVRKIRTNQRLQFSLTDQLSNEIQFALNDYALL